jgi:hypothetical protein
MQLAGGDWALQRLGAIHLEGTQRVGIQNCVVTRVDGNAVMLSGYNRNTTISRNEFAWIGDSVLASWGYTSPLGGQANDEILAQYRSGIDGTTGDQPRGTVASENFVHELGMCERLTSVARARKIKFRLDVQPLPAFVLCADAIDIRVPRISSRPLRETEQLLVSGQELPERYQAQHFFVS